MTLFKHKPDHVVILLSISWWLLISLRVKIEVLTAYRALHNCELTSTTLSTLLLLPLSPSLIPLSHTGGLAVPLCSELRAFALTISFAMLSFQPSAWLTLFPSSLHGNLTFSMCLMLVTLFNIAMPTLSTVALLMLFILPFFFFIALKTVFVYILSTASHTLLESELHEGRDHSVWHRIETQIFVEWMSFKNSCL